MANFNDVWNPTSSEIREWAFEKDSLEPSEDWNLALALTEFEDLFLELASDEECPKRRYFLGVLYLMVGDKVRAHFDQQAEINLRRFISKADGINHKDLRSWQSRSLDLLEDTDKFVYRDWCQGGLSSDS